MLELTRDMRQKRTDMRQKRTFSEHRDNAYLCRLGMTIGRRTHLCVQVLRLEHLLSLDGRKPSRPVRDGRDGAVGYETELGLDAS